MTPFLKGQKLYYKNQPVTYLTDIDSFDCVIEFEYESYRGDESYLDYGKMIVSKSQLTTSKFEFSQEYDKLVKELSDYKYKTTSEINKELSDKTKRLEDLNKRLKKIEPLNHLVDYLEGKAKYFVVETYYGPEIKLISELNYNDNFYNKEFKLKAFTIKRDKNDLAEKSTFSFKVTNYDDGSGGDYRAYPFFTKEEAIVKYKEMWLTEFKNSKNSSPKEKELVEYGITDKVFWDRINEIKEREKQYELEKLAKAEKEFLELKKKLSSSEISRA